VELKGTAAYKELLIKKIPLHIQWSTYYMRSCRCGYRCRPSNKTISVQMDNAILPMVGAMKRAVHAHRKDLGKAYAIVGSI
jgi:hypothetical protein